ncbi:MAG: ribonuclease P protein component 1 [Candidatus Nanohaloarchaea archaeon]|nr:ribonuclease P protein component 1 [Candidatus Nanohaloarchaea archaeon]
MRTAENLPRHELIGLEVEVMESTGSHTGIQGKVVDETRNTLVVETPEGEKTVPKKENSFRFIVDDLKVGVNGRLLEERPEERIGKRLPDKWEHLNKG